MIKYQNGNTEVTILDDGTKIREYSGIPKPVFPESIDIKITNYCDLGCAYCHEMSTTEGVHANLVHLIDKLEDLPVGTELAIGGGNPLSHPFIKHFLWCLTGQGFIPNLTVNQGHVKRFEAVLASIISMGHIKGLGISVLNSKNLSCLDLIRSLTSNIVYHVIAGKDKVEVMDDILKYDPNAKILILGFKHYGRGLSFYNEGINEELKRWKMYLARYFGKCIISFDNLAIEQLRVKRFFTQKGWDKFYMGDDFTFSMYIDAIKEEFAPTSRSSNRTSWNNLSIKDYFGGSVCT
jgi:organic radical activating enzyme